MDKPSWNEYQQTLKRGLSDLRTLPEGAERDRATRELIEQMHTWDDEVLPGEPEWRSLQRERLRKGEAHAHEARPIVAEVRKRIEEETGAAWQEEDLEIHPRLDISFMWFSVWYETDEDLERDRSSGRHDELASIMRRSATEIAAAESEVRFHSRETVGNNPNYFR